MNAPTLTIEAAASVEPRWRRHLLALGLVAAAVLVLFARDAGDMARIWWTSSTFNHCLLILPLLAWLVWQRRAVLAEVTPATWAPAGLVTAAGAVLWLLGEAASVALLRHVALVLMLQGAVLALLGQEAGRVLAFPLLYAFFLVPAGEELVPALQIVTADLCMALLGLVGIPAHLEGVFITTPGGYFEVAEACSGVKFLIAMVALAALVAHLCFRSWPRRIAFMAAAVVIPILANGVRAFATIWFAEGSSVEAATSFDHILYGWVFFAVVIALILGAGWPFFDRKPGEEIVPPPADTSVGRAQLAVTVGGLLALAVMPPLWARTAQGAVASLPSLAAPAISGWQATSPTASVPWRPMFRGADRLLRQTYVNAAGRSVDLVIAIYARQAEGRELVGYGQGAIPPRSDWSWVENGGGPPGGRSDRISALGTPREVVTFYRVGNVLTGNAADVKLETLKRRLLGGRQSAVAVLVSAEGREARDAIDAFLRSAGPIALLAESLAGVR